MVERLIVVANPSAGHGRTGRLIGQLDRLLHRAEVPHEIQLSDSAPDLQERVRLAAEGGAPVVGALGGDGTIGLAANGLIGAGATLSVFPSGTADDFAHAIGIKDLEAGVRALVEGASANIDLVRITAGDTVRHFVNVAGCGFDSEVNEAANAMSIKLGGTATYVAALLKTLPRFSPAGFRIELDDEVVEGPHMLVVVGNSTTYGGGMRVTPSASLVDGALDVCLLGEISKGAFLRTFPKVYRGTHVRHPAVRMTRARSVRIQADRRVMIYADGERVAPAPALFEVVPAALPVIVGPNPPSVR